MKIRVATAEDGPSLQIVAEALGPVFHDSAELEKSFAEIMAAEDQRIWISEVDDRVIGWLHAVVARRIGVAPFVEIVGLAVADRYRRKGFGQQLVAAAANWADSQNLSLKVRSNSKRAGAHAFYCAQGFTLQKQQHVFEQSAAVEITKGPQ